MLHNDKTVQKKNKIDLLKFQQNLNNQFLDIFNEKKDSPESSKVKSDTLGLVIEFNDLHFFIKLKDLKSISIKSKFENSIRTKSWLLGFNQEHGNVYTIFSINKIIDLLLNNNEDFIPVKVNSTSNIAFIQDISKDEHYGLLIETIKLEDINSFDEVFKVSINENKLSWQKNIELENLNREKLSENEQKIIDTIIKNVNSSTAIEEVGFESYENIDGFKKLSLIINGVFLNKYSNKPVFSINIKSLINFIKGQTPY